MRRLSEISTRFNVIDVIVNLFLSFVLAVIKVGRKLFINHSDKILVVAFHKLGDSIFSSYAIREIVNHYGNENVKIICDREYEILFKEIFPSVELILISREDFLWNGRIANRRIRKKISSNKYKIVFDLTGSILSCSLLIGVTAKKIVGMNLRHLKNFYDKYIPSRAIPHLTDRYLDIVELEIKINRDKIKREYDLNLNSVGEILIHPFAGWKAKEWNLSKFIQLAEKIKVEYRVKIIFFKNAISEDIINEMNYLKINHMSFNSVPELMSAVKGASLLISNDSGPIYLADYFGVPTLSIYGPTNPEFSMPLSKHHDFIQKKLNCSPKKNEQYCFTDGGYYCPSYECMNQLTVDEVYNLTSSILIKFGIKKIKQVN